MSSKKLLLAVIICVGAIYCPPYLVLSETSRLSQLTTLQTKTTEFIRNIDHSSTIDAYGQGKQHDSCPSVNSQELGHSVNGKKSNPNCQGSQNQNGQHLYLQASTANSSTVELHNTMPTTVLSSTETPVKREIISLVRAAAVYVLSYIGFVVLNASIPVLVISFLWLYFIGSLFFDVAHYFLHKFSKSRYWMLRRIGYLHEVHHLYFNRRLKFNNRYLWQNMACELPLELSCQLFGTWLGYLAAQALSFTGPGLLSQELFHLVLVFEVIRSFVVAILEGRDSNHQSYATVVPKDPHSFLVGPEYHALHHVDPSAYISSSFRVFDWFLGASYTLRSRRVVIVGLTGSFGHAMKRQLQSRESVNCVQELSIDEEHEKMIEPLSNTDVLIISPEDDSNESVVKIIELFKQHYTSRRGHSLLLPEVWYIGNQSRNHTSSAKRAFASRARTYYDTEDIIYRHIILSNLISYFGGILSGPDFEAKVALWWIRRGARYVQISSPGSALWGYFNFFYSV